MRAIPSTKEIRRLAKRVVWFEEPDVALQDPEHLVLHALEYGTATDMALVIELVGMDGVREALASGRPGIVGARSWAYWHAMTGTWPPPPMPERDLGSDFVS